jgi:hypothetical protein
VLDHIIEVLFALAALVSILDFFGVGPKQPHWGLPVPLKPKWKLTLMLVLVAGSLGMSGYGFYRAYRPKIVEKIVEKPVEKVVEKDIPQLCPQPQEKKPTKTRPPVSPSAPVPQNSSTTISAPNGIAIGGGTVYNPMVNNYGPPTRRISDEQKVSLTACLKTNPGKFTIGAIAGNNEAYAFAQDWYDVFMQAGWTNEWTSPIATIEIVGPPGPGVQIKIHGAWNDISQQASIIAGSPEQNALACLQGNVIGGGSAIPYTDMPTGSIRINISENQAK